MATAAKSKSNNTISKRDYEKMKKQLEDMQNLIIKLTANASLSESREDTSKKINNDKDITLTSLTVGELNLSTDGYGQGEVYTFTHFGDEQVIPYDEVKKIVKNNRRFVEGGNVFINDDEVIKELKLTNIYKKLLSYEKILELFKLDSRSFETILKGMTQNQKETLKGIIFDKLNKDAKSVDMNIVQTLNEDMEIDIMSDFKNQKELFKEITNS